MNSRSVTVIVPTLSAGRCRAVLVSLAQEGSEFETIVVDNRDRSSISDDPIGSMASVKVLEPGRNLGYSAAINLAAREAEGDTLVLLNDDCVVDQGFVSRIAAGIDPTSAVTMAAGVMRQSRNPDLIDSAGMELDETLLVFDYLNGQPLSVLEGDVPDPVGPSGAAAAFDRKSFLEVGGFDESLFAYWEDVDLVLRLRERGDRCRLVADARGTHEHSATLGSGSAEKNRLMGFGRGYVLRKWGVLTPRRTFAVAARDLPLALGQIVVDRNLGGLIGRIAGLRASPEPHSYPIGLPVSAGLGKNLRRRWLRRSEIRRVTQSGPVVVAFHTALMGGPLRSLENEIRWLASAHEVDVVVPLDEEKDPLFFGLGADIVSLPYRVPTLQGGLGGVLRTLGQQKRDFSMFRSFLRSSKPAAVVVVTTAVPALISAARVERIPIVLYAAELPAEVVRSRGVAIPSIRQVQRRASNFLGSSLATNVLACSPTVADEVSGRSPTLIHYPSIDPALSRGDGPGFRKRHRISEDAPVVSCVGSISPGRGQHVLIEALPALLARFPDLRLLLVGTPFPRSGDLEYSRHLDALIGQLGLSDSVVRIARVEPVGQLLAATNVLVNPALTHAESFGRVAFEAGYAGVPAVASSVGAIPELHEDGRTIRLVEPGSSREIAEAVTALLDSPDKSRELAEGAAEIAAELASPDQSLEVFKQAMRMVGVRSG